MKSQLEVLIRDFKKLQIHIIGYEMYKVTRKFETTIFDRKAMKMAAYWVDAYTSSGLLIKTKLNRITNYELIGFINDSVDQHCMTDEELADKLIKEISI